MFEYTASTSPQHFQKTALYLKNLRQNGDTRTCDITFNLHAKREYMHSSIAGAHSNFLLKKLKHEKTPLVLNMANFSPDAAHDIVNWMYFGTMDSAPETLLDHLIVSNFLGVIYLHRQLEMSLKLYSNDDPVVALNIAANEKSGITSEEINSVTQKVLEHRKSDRWIDDDTAILTKQAIGCLLRRSMSQTDKVHMINVALEWLRLENNVDHLEQTVGQINVESMAVCDQTAFQRTLATMMRNPHTRKGLTVIETKGHLAVKTKQSASGYSTPTLSDASETQISRKPSAVVVGKYDMPLNEVEALQAIDSENVFNVRGHALQHEVVSKRRLMSEPFRPRGRAYTTSEANYIDALPDYFNANDKTLPIGYTLSEIAYINGQPDHFGNKQVMPRKASWSQSVDRSRTARTNRSNPSRSPSPSNSRDRPRNHVVFTQSEVDSINCHPDPFARNLNNMLQKVAQMKSRDCSETNVSISYCGTLRPVFTYSEVQTIHKLPDPFGKNKKASPGEHNNPASYTRSEIKDIARLPDHFAKKVVHVPEKKGKSDSDSVPNPPDYFENKKPSKEEEAKLVPAALTQSEIADIGRLPDPFKEKRAKLTKSEVDLLAAIPNCFEEEKKEEEDRPTYTRSHAREIGDIPDPFNEKDLENRPTYPHHQAREIGGVPDSLKEKAVEPSAGHKKRSMLDLKTLWLADRDQSAPKQKKDADVAEGMVKKFEDAKNSAEEPNVYPMHTFSEVKEIQAIPDLFEQYEAPGRLPSNISTAQSFSDIRSSGRETNDRATCCAHTGAEDQDKSPNASNNKKQPKSTSSYYASNVPSARTNSYYAE